MTLVAWMAGLFVAAIVASVVALSLSIDVRVHARFAQGTRDADAAWLILAAVASDPDESNWPVVGRTLRHRAQPVADGIRSLQVRAERNGLRELRLTLDDGRVFSRVVAVR